MKKLISIVVVTALAAALCGCAANTPAADPSAAPSSQADGSAAMTGSITVISREDGSGTRGAFIELFGVEQKDADGVKTDMTTATADITNSTGVMLQSVSQNSSAIGYVSLGSMNDSVKALEIDGAAATVENIKNGGYAVSRPFNIVTTDSVSPLASDFIDYILSTEGQAVVEENGYIAASDTSAYSGGGLSGKLTVAGSSSVSPLMEKLIEGYGAVNPDADIELQTSDSTTGVNGVLEGICDIGMASRELKDSESGAGARSTVIATDGIAVIVSTENPIDGLTSRQVMEIYTGEIASWEELS